MIRACKLCGRSVDFSAPWCDHETMEESAWLNMPRMKHLEISEEIIDSAIAVVAVELGYRAAEMFKEQCKEVFG